MAKAVVRALALLAFVATLIPAWFPGNPILWSQFAGLALLVFGVGLLFSRTAPISALLTGAGQFPS